MLENTARSSQNISGSLHFQKRPNSPRQRMVDFALPDHQHLPAHLPQPFHCGFVSLTGFRNLGNPVVSIRFRFSRSARTVVAVPETSMHEDRLAAGNKGKVRFPRQILAMQPVAIPHGMNEPADSHLRLGVATSDSPHNAAAEFIHPDSVAITLCMYRTRLRRTCVRGSICFRRRSESGTGARRRRGAVFSNGGDSCI